MEDRIPESWIPDLDPDLKIVPSWTYELRSDEMVY